ncbi:MAG: hypothetical protein R3C14_51815 [Caldilineaceae bacterium]
MAVKDKNRKQAKSKAKRNGAVSQQLTELSDFTQAFFSTLGGEVQQSARRKALSPLEVALTGDLADHFGASALALTFQQSEQTPAQELVVHGSPVFDKMMGYLARRSNVTYQRLPLRHSGGEELLHAVRPVNAGIVGLRMQEQVQHLYVFNWHITYRADDKREEIYTVILDEEGQRVANADEPGAAAQALKLADLLADAEPAPAEKNEEGQPIPPRLPAMVQLVRLAESARKYAIYHADVCCVTHEAEILPRLYKTLNRLTTYYQQQIEEVYEAHDPSGEKRQALEVDLERKLAEEVENHRLRVQVDLFSYAVLQMPVAVAEMTLSDGQQEVGIRILRNRYTGALQLPVCYACGAAVKQLVLDRNGHVICDSCLQQCATCQEIVCQQDGVFVCPACGQENCDRCSRTCWACGERACAQHIDPCPVCGDEVCHSCQSACAACGVVQCRSHLRVDHVRQLAGETVLVCSECAIRCAGCEQYSAQIGICSSSGQRFCLDCLTPCSSCGALVGPGFAHIIDGAAYCQRCLVECPTCQTLTTTPHRCPHCQESYCHACGGECVLCHQTFCRDHSHHYADCGHTVCYAHAGHCHQCDEALCPLCSTVCAICERYHCASHTTSCSRCGQLYCSSCIQANGLCETCAIIERQGEIVKLANEPCGHDERVAPLANEFTWRRARNQRYTIYWGYNTARRNALVVVAQREAGIEIVAATTIDATGARPEVGQEVDTHAWLRDFQSWLNRMRRSGRGRR